MRFGKVIRIITDRGAFEELNVLCSFKYDGQYYLLAADESNDYICRKIKCNPWKGAYTDTGPVSVEAARIANVILKKAENNSDFYKLDAEHYLISDDRGTIHIRKSGKLNLFYKGAKYSPFIKQLIIALFFALLYGFICVHTAELSIAANVFNISSKEILVATAYLIQLFGAMILFFARKSKRTWFDLYLNSIIPFNTVTLIGVFRASKGIRITVFFIVIGSFLIWILPKIIQAARTENKAKRQKYWKTALRRCFTPFVMCICVAYIAIHFLGISVYICSSSKAGSAGIQLSESFDGVKNSLQSENWKTYGNQEKLDILQAVCDYECRNNLGCDPPKVVAGRPTRDTICGSYNSKTKTITINIEHLANAPAENVLNTLLHEVRHAYQYETVDAFNAVEDSLDEEAKSLQCFRIIESYRYSLDNYIDSSEDYALYYNQAVEIDSRSWAEQRLLSEYYYYIYPSSADEQSDPAENAADPDKNCINR